jgi:hypothetical protein
LAFCFDRSDNALYLLNEESRNIWITPENYQEIAVVFGPQFVRATVWMWRNSKDCSWRRLTAGRTPCSVAG